MIVKTSKGDLPVRYGWSALAKFGDLCDISMDKVLSMDFSNMKMTDMLRFLMVGFEDGARKEGVECQIKSTDDIGDILDDDPEVLQRVMEAFGEMSISMSKDKGKDNKKK